MTADSPTFFRLFSESTSHNMSSGVEERDELPPDTTGERRQLLLSEVLETCNSNMIRSSREKCPMLDSDSVNSQLLFDLLLILLPTLPPACTLLGDTFEENHTLNAFHN